MSGKGSKRRPEDVEAYSNNYDAIFGKKRREVPTIDPEVEDSWEDSAESLIDFNTTLEQNLND